MTIEKNPVVPPRPLRESEKESITHFFDQLDGATCTDLHALVLAQVEEPLFRAVMQETCVNQSKAAAILGLNRGTLRKKLRQYHLI